MSRYQTPSSGAPQSLRNRWFMVLLGHAALVQAVTFVLRPMISYRALDLGVPAEYLGLLGASFAIVPLVLAVPVGRSADRVGERPLIVIGGLLMAASAVGFVFVGDTVIGMVLGSLVLGTGHLLSQVGGQAIVGHVGVRSGRLDSAFGFYTFAASLGQTIGPLLLILASASESSPDAGPVFTMAGVLSIAALLAALAVRPPPREKTEEHAVSPSVADVLRLPGLWRALMSAAIILSAVDILIVYLPAYGAAAGLTVGAIGLLLALRSGASMVSRLFMGTISKRLGRGPFLVYCTMGSALAVLALGLPLPMPVLIVAVVIAGFCLGVGQPLTMSWLVEVAPANLRGTALSLRLVGNRLGQVLVPSLAGLVAGSSGAGGVLAFTAVTLVIAAGATRRGGLGLSGGPD